MADLPQFLKDDIADIQAKGSTFGDVAATLPAKKAAVDAATADYQANLASSAQAKNDLDASITKLVTDVTLYEAGGTPPPPPPAPPPAPQDTLPGGGGPAMLSKRTK